MPSKYYTPPTALAPFTTARSSAINNDFSGVDAAFVLVAADMLKTLSHATLTLSPLAQTAGQMAGKVVALDGTGSNLTTITGLGTWRGTWATATSYNVGDVFQHANAPFSVYYVINNYTSGASLAADVAAGNAALAISFANVSYTLPVTIETASFTAVVGNIYVIPSAAATVNVQLPAGAASTPGKSSLIVVTVAAAVTKAVNLVPSGPDLINSINAITVLRGAADTEIRAANIYWSGATAGWLSV